jgi:DNA repair protein RadB
MTRFETLGTGAESLDRLLRGGFPSKQLTFVYGKANAGKTIVAMSSAIQAAKKGGRVFYIDADRSFSIQRLPVEPEVLERILLFQPEDFREQTRIIENIENLLRDSRTLIVIDSVTTLYRVDSVGVREALIHNRELNRQLAYLADLAARYEVTVLLTGQVHSHPEGGFWTTEPVADRTLQHWAKLILRLRQTKERDVREAKLEKIHGRDTEDGPRAFFSIDETGIRDAQA